MTNIKLTEVRTRVCLRVVLSDLAARVGRNSIQVPCPNTAPAAAGCSRIYDENERIREYKQRIIQSNDRQVSKFVCGRNRNEHNNIANHEIVKKS